jgi:hypothetical protein
MSMKILLIWLAVGHVLLKHSFKYADNLLICDLDIKVPIYNLPAGIAGGRVPGVLLRYTIRHKNGAAKARGATHSDAVAGKSLGDQFPVDNKTVVPSIMAYLLCE